MAGKKKKSSRFVRAIFVLSAAAVAVLTWYGHKVYVYVASGEYKKGAATEIKAEAEIEPEPEIDPELRRLAEEGNFKAEEVVSCEAVSSQYRDLKGKSLEGEDVRRLLNLPDEASSAAVRARCIDFAKSVAKMEEISRHSLYVMVCGKSHYEVENDERYTIRPDPGGWGVIQTVTPALPENLDIPIGRSRIIHHWQAFNMGGGCVIIGDSLVYGAKGGSRRRGAFFTDAFNEFSFPK